MAHDNPLPQTPASNRAFFALWSTQAFSLLGSQLVQFALVWWLTRTTYSPNTLVGASLAALLPQIILGPFAGVLVDRWNRRVLMLVVDLAIAALTLGLAGLFWLGLAQVWTIYLLLALRSCGAAFHWPAMQASTTLMVPEQNLGRVGGFNQVLSGVAGIAIPPLGALAVELLPMGSILLVDVVTAIPAIAVLAVIAIPQPAPVTPEPGAGYGKRTMMADLRAGLRFIFGWKELLILAGVGVMINLLGRAAGSLMPLLALQDFQVGAIGLGVWQAAAGIGTILGGFVLGMWGTMPRKIRVQMAALTLDGVAMLLVGISPPRAFLFTVGLIFFSGFLEAVVLALGGAIFQTLVPPQAQGRVFAVLMSLTQALAPLGLVVAGPVAQARGVAFWWVLTGGVIIAMGLLILLLPSMARVEQTGCPPELLEVGIV